MNLADTILARLRPCAGTDPAYAEDLIKQMLSPSELRRMAASVALIPKAEFSGAHLTDIGGTVFWLPLYLNLGYTYITVIVRPGGGHFDSFEVLVDREFKLEIAEADAELDPYPIDSESVQCVVCFELLEHFAGDPMHFLTESNRILSRGGVLCLTTPNVLWHQNVVNILLGQHPFGWSVFTDSYADRHNREYTPFEIRGLLEAGGYTVEGLSTATYHEQPWRRRALGRVLCSPAALAGRVSLALREGQILARARKICPVKDRYPAFLYNLYGRPRVALKVRTAPFSS